ncbi:hypothetical protein ACVC7V_09920 [Hydrogenophaga sp. A37]|uniref:hypothetical protein n=1 Tax=Hydrogenophaga sp. A37 TaxID=1945864 RepID=UPI0009857D44|nr:hypothetical protein [Hydrogenophaga sp. A37]OOG85498.1 hypothetical protein B0E41_08150 [Hydrogenophaga sp. A37]
MLTSKFLTASLTALAVVGSAGFVYAQSTSGTVTPSTEPTVQAQPSVTPSVSGSMNTPAMNQDASTMEQPLVRADRN